MLSGFYSVNLKQCLLHHYLPFLGLQRGIAIDHEVLWQSEFFSSWSGLFLLPELQSIGQDHAVTSGGAEGLLGSWSSQLCALEAPPEAWGWCGDLT